MGLCSFKTGDGPQYGVIGPGGGIVDLTATLCASITIGGPDLRMVYVGSLRASNIPYFTSPVAGLPLLHWNELN